MKLIMINFSKSLNSNCPREESYFPLMGIGLTSESTALKQDDNNFAW